MVSTGLPVNCMVLAIYGKYDDGWKLNILQMGEYSVMDQTAPEYYNVALNQYAKRNYIDAVDMIMTASQVTHPGGSIFLYLKDYEMKDTYSVILKDANTQYHLPLTLEQVKTKPQIFSISPQFAINMEPQGILPMIKYKSIIPLTDTVALKAENKGVQAAVADIFAGANKNKPGIFYRVYNKMPNEKIEVNYYTFIQRTKYGKSE